MEMLTGKFKCQGFMQNVFKYCVKIRLMCNFSHHSQSENLKEGGNFFLFKYLALILHSKDGAADKYMYKRGGKDTAEPHVVLQIINATHRGKPRCVLSVLHGGLAAAFTAGPEALLTKNLSNKQQLDGGRGVAIERVRVEGFLGPGLVPWIRLYLGLLLLYRSFFPHTLMHKKIL